VKAKADKNSKVYLKMKPLSTPDFVKKINYIRCNCNEGVPSDSDRFEIIPLNITVGKIWVQSYHEIMIPSDRRRYLNSLRELYPEKAAARKLSQFNEAFTTVVPIIMSFLPLGLCAPIPQVNTHWNIGAQLYTQYIDMRNCVPWQCYRVHNSQVDAVLVLGDKAFSGGDKRVVVSNVEKGEVIATVTRDSGRRALLLLL